MKRSTSKYILMFFLLVGRFVYGQENEVRKIIEIDATFRSFPNTQCEYSNNRIYLVELGKLKNNRTYLITNFKFIEGDAYLINTDTIQNIPRHYTLEIIGKMKVDNCPEKARIFEVCEIIDHKPIRFIRNYKLNTNVVCSLEGKWKFIGFRNSKDSIYLDSNMICCGVPTFKFETYDANDSIFYPPSRSNYYLTFEENSKPLTDLGTYILNVGTDISTDGYCILDNNLIEFHRECFIISGGSFSGVENYNYEKLFERVFYSIKKYSINHNILTLYDNNSSREMIFVRDEK